MKIILISIALIVIVTVIMVIISGNNTSQNNMTTNQDQESKSTERTQINPKDNTDSRVEDTKQKAPKPKDGELVFVSTYGPTIQGSPFYEKYIETLVDYLEKNKNQVNSIVIVGGYTFDKDKSQAQAVVDYVQKNFPLDLEDFNLYLDECGITTSQNVEHARDIIEKNDLKPEKITLFVEESKAKKLKFFANVSLINPASKETREELLNEIAPLTDLNEAERIAIYHDSQDYSFNRFLKDNDQINLVTVDSELPAEIDKLEYASFVTELQRHFDPSLNQQLIDERLESWTENVDFSVRENLVNKGCQQYKKN